MASSSSKSKLPLKEAFLGYSNLAPSPTPVTTLAFDSSVLKNIYSSIVVGILIIIYLHLSWLSMHLHH